MNRAASVRPLLAARFGVQVAGGQVVIRFDGAHPAQDGRVRDDMTTHMIRSVAQHMAYHAGQIALTRKIAEAR